MRNSRNYTTPFISRFPIHISRTYCTLRSPIKPPILIELTTMMKLNSIWKVPKLAMTHKLCVL